MMALNPEVVRAFDGARDYDRHASVQRQAAEALAERVGRLPLPSRPDILEIGCGTGLLSRALLARLPHARWLLTDVAEAMVARCAAAIGPREDVRYAVMDGEAPELPPAGFDVIVSSFTFQWFSDLPGSLARLAGLLRPGGTLAFATMIEGSFAEWREAHQTMTGSEPAMNHYPSAHALKAMAPPGLSAHIVEALLVEEHGNARAFLRSLRAIGAHRPLRPQPPVDAGALRRTMVRFEATGSRISYRVAYAIMKKGVG